MTSMSRSVVNAIKKVVRSGLIAKKDQVKNQVILNHDGSPSQTVLSTRDFRLDRGHIGFYHLQINAETGNKDLQRFIKENGTHLKIARINVADMTGTDEDVERIIEGR